MGDMRTPLVAAFFLVALHAQEEGAETYGHSRHGTTFDEGPRSAA